MLILTEKFLERRNEKDDLYEKLCLRALTLPEYF